MIARPRAMSAAAEEAVVELPAAADSTPGLDQSTLRMTRSALLAMTRSGLRIGP